MKKERKNLPRFFNRVHLFFFTLSFTFKIPEWCVMIFWILERLIVITPVLIYVLSDTPWNSINSILSYFNVLTFFEGGTNQFSIFCYVVIGIVHGFLFLFLYRLIFWKKNCNTFLGYFISFGYCIYYRVIYVIVFTCTLYVYNRLDEKKLYNPHKKISGTMIESKSINHFILLVLMSITLLEMTIMNLMVVFFYQTKRFVLWSTYTWKIELLNNLLKIVLVISVIIDTNNDYTLIFSIIIGLLILFQIILRFMTPLYYDPIIDLIELSFDCCLFLFEGIIITVLVFEFIEIKNCYQYSILIPILAIMFCAIKYFATERKIPTSTNSEDDAIVCLRAIIRISMNRHTGFRALLSSLILHRNNCARASCECRTLITQVSDPEVASETLELNFKAYKTNHEVPIKIRNSWKRKVVSLLAAEFNSQASKAYQVPLALAEIAFYYEGNIYRALNYLANMKSIEQSAIYDQYIINMKETIEEGMWKNTKDIGILMDIVDFQRKYDKFLDYIEDATAETIGLWKTLSSHRIDIDAFMKKSRKFYELNYNVMALAKEINELNPHHLEFLIKYGLYMRLIANDKVTTTKVFNTMVSVAEGFNLGLKRIEKNFSLKKSEGNAMIVIISLEKDNFFQIIEANNEILYHLGYKREELLKFSANKIIPQEIVNSHYQLIHKFFQTMESACVGKKILKFFKHKKEYIVPCTMMLHLIPSIKDGLKVVAVFYVDEGISMFVSKGVDRIKHKVMICISLGWSNNL